MRSSLSLPLLLLVPVLAAAWGAEPAVEADVAKRPPAPLPTVSLSNAWLSRHWTGDGKGGLTADQGTLNLELHVAPPAGWRVVGTPLLALRSAMSADGHDLRRRPAEAAIEPLSEDDGRDVSFEVSAPADSGAGLADLSGALTVRLAPDAPKEALFKPLSAWLGRSATLAGEPGTEVSFTKDDAGTVWVEFNGEAAARFTGLALVDGDGKEIAVTADSDGTDDDKNMAYRQLPSPLADGAALTLRFVTAPQTRQVPFHYAPLALPALTPRPTPEAVPLVKPQAPAQLVPVPTDNRF